MIDTDALTVADYELLEFVYNNLKEAGYVVATVPIEDFMKGALEGFYTEVEVDE